MKKRKFKKLVALVLTLALILGSMPATEMKAKAAGSATTYDFRDGSIVPTDTDGKSDYTSEDGKLTVKKSSQATFYYHGETYGVCFVVGSSIEINVSGNAKIEVADSNANSSSTYTLKSDEAGYSEEKSANNGLGQVVEFNYNKGEATTLTLTFDNTNYIPYVTVEEIATEPAITPEAEEKAYDLKGGTLIPTDMAATTEDINFGALTLVSNGKTFQYNNHGVVCPNGTSIEIVVGGPVDIVIGSCQYNNGQNSIDLNLKDKATGTTIATKTLNNACYPAENSTVTFNYTGEAATLVIPFTGQVYVPYVKVTPVNVEEAPSTPEPEEAPKFDVEVALSGLNEVDASNVVCKLTNKSDASDTYEVAVGEKVQLKNGEYSLVVTGLEQYTYIQKTVPTVTVNNEGVTATVVFEEVDRNWSFAAATKYNQVQTVGTKQYFAGLEITGSVKVHNNTYLLGQKDGTITVPGVKAGDKITVSYCYTGNFTIGDQTGDVTSNSTSQIDTVVYTATADGDAVITCAGTTYFTGIKVTTPEVVPTYEVTVNLSGLGDVDKSGVTYKFTNKDDETDTYSFAITDTILLQNGEYTLKILGLENEKYFIKTANNVVVNSEAVTTTVAFEAIDRDWVFADVAKHDTVQKIGEKYYIAGLEITGSVSAHNNTYLHGSAGGTITVPGVKKGDLITVSFCYKANLTLGDQTGETSSNKTNVIETISYTATEDGDAIITCVGESYLTEIKVTTPEPTEEPTPEPEQETTNTPTPEPEQETTNTPTPEPEQETTNTPTPEPEQETTNTPTPEPEQETTNTPTPEPEQEITNTPTPEPEQETTNTPTPEPEQETTNTPTPEPEQETTNTPTPEPEQETTNTPTPEPEQETTNTPTPEPEQETTSTPTPEPTKEPTPEPTKEPTPEPTAEPTAEPTVEPTAEPTKPAEDKAPATVEEMIKDIAIENKAEVVNAILTAEEKKLVENGAELEVKLEVSQITNSVSKDEIKLVEKVLDENMKIGAVLDINLMKKVGDKDSEKVSEVKGTSVNISIKIPDEMYEKERMYSLLRLHDGRVDVLGAYDSKSRCINAHSDRFSTYFIVYTDVTVPATGDSFPVAGLVVIAIPAIAFVAFRRKKKELDF